MKLTRRKLKRLIREAVKTLYKDLAPRIQHTGPLPTEIYLAVSDMLVANCTKAGDNPAEMQKRIDGSYPYFIQAVDMALGNTGDSLDRDVQNQKFDDFYKNPEGLQMRPGDDVFSFASYSGNYGPVIRYFEKKLYDCIGRQELRNAIRKMERALRDNLHGGHVSEEQNQLELDRMMGF